MKAPQKIYLHGYCFDDEPCKNWTIDKSIRGMRGYQVEYAEYIRKDIAEQSAKDTIARIKEWANEEKGKCQEETHPYSMFMNVLLDKLSELEKEYE